MVSRGDIIGTWKDMMFLPYDGAYEFHADGSFSAYWEDQVDAGKWIFHPPAKIELISYSDYVTRQYSGKSLNVNEDYPVAGIDGVRGYLEAEVLGDRAVKGTVQLQSPVWQRGAKSLADGFLYVDAAVADMLEALPGEPLRTHPRSWGLGVDLLPAGKITGSLVWARPLVSASATRADESRLLFLVRSTF